jgi:hypothetical protein
MTRKGSITITVPFELRVQEMTEEGNRNLAEALRVQLHKAIKRKAQELNKERKMVQCVPTLTSSFWLESDRPKELICPQCGERYAEAEPGGICGRDLTEEINNTLQMNLSERSVICQGIIEEFYV